MHKTTDLISSSKKRIFILILVLLPVLVLLLLEGVLRFMDYGGNLQLFVEAKPPYANYVKQNQDVARRYFHTIKTIPTPSPDFFLKEKPENGLRIFVLGGSTTAGFPYENNLAFGRILDGLLTESFPDRSVEVVTVAMSAINSYTLLDFMDEILAKQPDAVLVYAGHNEYYGALGVASMQRIGRRRGFVLASMKIQSFRVIRLIRDGVNGMRRLFAGQAVNPYATLMERMIGEKEIPEGSDLFRLGQEQFMANLLDIVKKAQRKKVPVVLSELVSNVRDQAPFLSAEAEAAESAEARYQEAVRLDSAGDFSEARDLYERAKDLDPLRFRAHSGFNNIIHTVGKDTQIPVVPMKTLFESGSDHGLLGDNLMTDHLHPNIKGCFLLARGFYKTMASRELFGLQWPEPDFQNLENHWGYSSLDSLTADFSIKTLKNGWPFREDGTGVQILDSVQTGSEAEKLAVQVIKFDDYSLAKAHRDLAVYYEQAGQLEAALQEYRALLTMNRLFEDDYIQAAGLAEKCGHPEETRKFLEQSLTIRETAKAHALLGQLFLKLGDDRKAVSHLERNILLEPKNIQLPILKHLIEAHTRLGQKNQAQAWMAELKRIDPNLVEQVRSRKVETYSGIRSPKVTQMLSRAQKLIQSRQIDLALPLLAESLQIEETAIAHRWIGKIYLMQNKTGLAIRHLEKASGEMKTDDRVLYELMVAYTADGNLDQARAVLSRLEQLNPQFRDPMGIRQRLK